MNNFQRFTNWFSATKSHVVATAMCVLATCHIATAQQPVTNHVIYEYSDENFTNPERGLYKHIGIVASNGNTISQSSLNSYRQQGFSLVYTGYVLNSFRNGNALSDSFLNNVRTDMQRLRTAGLKAVVRFYYSDENADKPWDVPLDLTLEHINQLKPIFEEYADVIALVEAGFVGLWGEWAYTDNHVNNPLSNGDYKNRRKIVETLAEAVPTERKIALRTPSHKMGILRTKAKDTLTVENAYDESLAARFGFHNDCFLANEDDGGTYKNVEANRTYAKMDSRYTVMGGETCSDANSFTEISNARQAFADYHWTFLNSSYHPGTIGSWTSSGFMDEIKRRLGYRLVLLEGDFPKEAAPGGNFTAQLIIENVGWAAPINPRDVELVFVASDGSRTVMKLDVDPRRWQPGFIHKLNINLNLPEQISTGHCKVYLNLPDPKPTIHDRVEYAIRLANTDCWDATTGMNHLTDIEITTDAGVDNVVSDAQQELTGTPIYDTLGRRAGTVGTTSTLSPGIYIIAGKKYRF